jgi:hypothetical protein
MVKSASTKLVREIMGGESYEYYPLGQDIVVAPGGVEADRHLHIRALMSIMRSAILHPEFSLAYQNTLR